MPAHHFHRDDVPGLVALGAGGLVFVDSDQLAAE